MKNKTISYILAAVFLAILGTTGMAQEKKGKVTIATPAKMVISKIKIGEGDAYDVRGKAVFTATSANMDDSVTGDITYTIPEDAKQKIAQLTGKPVHLIPTRFVFQHEVARFQPATACPVIHLEFSPTQIDIAGVKAVFGRFVLDLNESKLEKDVLFCVWTRQINTGQSRRGVIKRLNVLINGEEEESQIGN